MLSLQVFKKLELEVHQEMYSNIHLLNSFYKPSPPFLALFKKDMFIKSNKLAFHEVVYYLLSIIDPKNTKNRIKWPLYDTSFESEFRAQVMNFVNELRTLYTSYNIPLVTMPLLLTPGGMKFVKFILKLSILALSVHVKNSSSCPILGPLRPLIGNNEVPKINLEKATSTINAKTQTIQDNLKNSCLKAQELRENGTNEVKQLERECRKKLNEYNKLQATFNEKYPEYNDKMLEVRTTEVVQQNEILHQIRHKYEACKEVIAHLKSNKAILEFNSETSTIGNNTYENGALDLEKLLIYFNQIMSKISMEIQPLNNEELSKHIHQYGEYCQQLKIINMKLDDTLSKINQFNQVLEKYGANETASSGSPFVVKRPPMMRVAECGIDIVISSPSNEDGTPSQCMLAMPLPETPINS